MSEKSESGTPGVSESPEFPELPAAPRPQPRGRSVLVWLLGVMLLGSLSLNVVLVVVGAMSVAATPVVQEQPLDEVEVGGKGDAKVLLLRCHGVISGTASTSMFGVIEDMPTRVDRALSKATKDNAIKAVVISVNSPGGSVTASHKVWARIEKFKKARSDVKVVAYLDEVAASGGYYIAAGADAIVAHETALTGSIGVVMGGFELTKLLEKVGVERRTLTSGKTPLKDMLSPYRPMGEEERAIVQSILDESYDRFVDVVARGRKSLGREQVVKVADGRIYTAMQAREAGLVDTLGDRSKAIAEALKLAGEKEATLIVYKRTPSLMEQLFVPPSSARTSGELVIRIDPLAVADAQRPRLYYLWNGQ